jgi:hypothetical protein
MDWNPNLIPSLWYDLEEVSSLPESYGATTTIFLLHCFGKEYMS